MARLSAGCAAGGNAFNVGTLLVASGQHDVVLVVGGVSVGRYDYVARAVETAGGKTTTYAYNADGTPASKTDAKNQKVEYVYDSYQRVTQIKRYPVSGGNEDACQRVDLSYDTNPYESGYTQNGWGRLAAARFARRRASR